MNAETREAVHEVAPSLRVLAEHDRPAGNAAQAILDAADAEQGGSP